MGDQEYISIWEDYRIARETLIAADEDFFNALDKVNLPGTREYSLLINKNKTFTGFPQNSRNKINTAIDNALTYIQEYEAMNHEPPEATKGAKESAELIIQIMSNWSSMIASFDEHRKDITPIQISNEPEMQYLLKGILRLFFDDIRPETYTPNYANKSNRTDFLLPKQRILIETKMTRTGLNDKQLGEELIIDKEHYRNHPNVDIILCLVYDPDRRIKNPEGIKDIQELKDPPYFSIHFFN